MKLLILYHSGAGSTRAVAGQFSRRLEKEFKTDLFSIEALPQNFNICSYDGFIIGYPVYHAQPQARLLRFFDGIDPLLKQKPVFIFNTRGLYAANSQRLLAKHLHKKGLRVIMDEEYKSPASDVSLLLPFIKTVWNFEKGIEDKIDSHSKRFIELMRQGRYRYYIPRYRLYSILNAPNRLLGRLFTFSIYLHRDKCIKCCKCSVNCPGGALVAGEDQYPAFQKKKCESCYRCIHQCPSLALSLSKRCPPKRVIRY